MTAQAKHKSKALMLMAGLAAMSPSLALAANDGTKGFVNKLLNFDFFQFVQPVMSGAWVVGVVIIAICLYMFYRYFTDDQYKREHKQVGMWVGLVVGGALMGLSAVARDSRDMFTDGQDAVELGKPTFK